MAWNIPSVTLCQLSQLCPLPTICSTQPTHFWGWGVEQVLTICTQLNNSQITGVFSTLFQLQMQNTAPYRLPRKKVSSAQPDSIQSQPLIPCRFHHAQVPHNLIQLHVLWTFMPSVKDITQDRRSIILVHWAPRLAWSGSPLYSHSFLRGSFLFGSDSSCCIAYYTM